MFTVPLVGHPTIVAPSNTKPLFLIIDGHSLAFRTYYAYAKSRDGGLRTSTGIPTSICFGFLRFLLDTIVAESPQAVAIAFDLEGPTFRHEADVTYKAGRPETPEDFQEDLNNLLVLLQRLNLTIATAPGYEADDVIGTLAQQASAAGHRTKILTGDQDLFQVVDQDKGITVLHLGNPFGQRQKNPHPNEFGPEAVQAKLGIWPHQVVDYKALCGDSSDNIPGVKGVGPKTAVQLLETYGSLAGIYEALDEIQGAVKAKLMQGKTAAQHSQFLAQIILDVPLDIPLSAFQLKGFAPEQLEPILEKLELRTFRRQINTLQERLGGIPLNGLAAPVHEEDEALWFFSPEDTHRSQTVAIAPQIITTPAQLTDLVSLLQTCTDPMTPVAWDTETDSLDPRNAALVGIGCCWREAPEAIAYIPLGHKTGENLDLDLVLAQLRPILEGDRYPKVCQNTKFDRLVLRHHGVTLAGVIFDTLLASYVLNPEGSHGLTDLSAQYLELKAQSYESLVPKGKTIADVDIPAVAEYCGMDVYGAFRLVAPLREALGAIPSLYQLLVDVELPLEPVLAEMEYTGIRINPAYLASFSQQLAADLEAIESQAHDLIPEATFNINSPKQLSVLLFETLQLNARKSRKTQLGYSTDAATLEKLRGEHPIIDVILEYRTLAKLKSTYVDALPALVNPETRRVHTDFNQAVTATGRLSSSNPNLQNIPIRTAFGRQIRQAFIPESGWLLVKADYSQIELRILAHLSQEPVLIDAYKNNRDVHTLTAQLLLEKETINADERRLGKVINFGVIYGMGAQRFARETGVNSREAKEFIDRFNERYPTVFAFLQRMQRQAIAQGHVETIQGRRRYFKFTSRELQQLRGQDPNSIQLEKLHPGRYDAGLLRAAANAPIQGSSADIIKIAMVELHGILKSHQARLLLQVHDELVFELPAEEWLELEPLIKTTMEGVVPLQVPLVVDVHAAENWMEAA